MLGDHIELKVLQADGDSVKLGIAAPRDVEVFRKEIYDAIQETNKEASTSTQLDVEMIRHLLGEKDKKDEEE